MSPVRSTLAGDEIGMIVMDPGQRTGLMWGDFTLEGESTYAMVRDGIHGSLDFQMEDEIEMAELVAEQYLECAFHWSTELSIPKTHQFFVYEDFQLRMMSMERNLLSPVRITYLVKGMLFKYEPQYMTIQPSETHSVTGKQLRQHDLWIPGKQRKGDHQIDVRCQAIQAVRKLIS